MKIFGVTGWKNAGKTGLMERLVAEITARGFSVSTIKHAHHTFDVDHPGKDSYRHRAAGANEVLIGSRRRWALMHECRPPEDVPLADLLARMAPVDLVLIEGYKRDRHQKIEAYRAETEHPLISDQDDTICAIAADCALPDARVPVIDLDDTGALADLVLERCGLGQMPPLAGVPVPDITPPPLNNDCFALPRGVSWMPVHEALALLEARLVPVCGIEMLPVPAALGRILGRDVAARRANPPGANSAVDGYGFAGADIGAGPHVLPLVAGRAAAGAPFAGAVSPGQAVRILTGALLPEGVDTVVLQEDVHVEAGHVAFQGPLRQGANARRAGEDIDAGAVALRAGQKLRAPDLALLSAVGQSEAPVRKRLRVGVLSTGDELAAPGSTPDVARTYDANRPMLLGLAQGWDYEARDLGHVRDDRAALRAAFDAAADQVDVIVTSGGASAGDEDHVSALLTEEGQMQAWRIAMKPGRPLALALWRGVPVFGLPGNPVAAMVCALIFARPAFSRLAGGGWLVPRGFDLPAAFAKKKKAGRREYLRARLTDTGQVEVFKSEGSGRITGLSWADGLVDLDESARDIAPGDMVRFVPYASFGV